MTQFNSAVKLALQQFALGVVLAYDVEIKAPQALRQRVAEQAQAMLQQYQD